MKKFKFLTVAVIAIATFSAFNSSGSSKKVQASSYGWVKIFGNQCTSGSLDWGYVCDQSWYGQVCTIQSQPAFRDELYCQYGSSFNYLRREF